MSEVSVLRKENETPKDYRIRLYKNKDLYNLSNKEIGELCNEAFGVDYDESAHRKKVKNYLKGYEDAMKEVAENSQTDEVKKYVSQMSQLKNDIQRERYKLQSEKLDYNRTVREEARDDLITDKIVNAVKELPKKKVKFNHRKIQETEKEYVLLMGDQHYGCEFQIKDLQGNILNEYSPEVFENRMELLYNKLINFIEKESVSLLHIYDLGDSIDGCLRVSQLWKLRYGVIDATIYYANYMAEWLQKLSEYVDIEYQMVIDANHSQLRMLGQPKNTFKEDNLSKVIAWFIKEKLSDNPHFVFNQNDTGYVFANLNGFNLLGIHGDMKNVNTAINNFSMIYNIDINYFVSGHYHHNKQEEVGMKHEAISVGSVMGADDYAFSLQKVSLPSVKILCIEKDVGKTMEYTIPLV